MPDEIKTLEDAIATLVQTLGPETALKIAQIIRQDALDRVAMKMRGIAYRNTNAQTFSSWLLHE